MIVIIDYGMGNLRSVEKAFEKVGFKAMVTDKSEMIDKADKIVLPGVGAFKDAMDGLLERNLIEPIINHIKRCKPFLGICLGLQLLFTKSNEGGKHKGLNIIDGEAVRFTPLEKVRPVKDGFSKGVGASSLTGYRRLPVRDRTQTGNKTEKSSKSLFGKENHKLKIPHMGWNKIKIKKKVPILKGLPDDSYMYFVHSYYVIPDCSDIIATETEYGTVFVSMISVDNINAMQFHPEKSQRYGLTILKNFGELC